MLFQTFRIWTFRVFINRRVLIDCKFWTEQNVDDDWQKTAKKTSWFDRATNSHWLLFFISLCHLLSYRCWNVINSFFIDVDCENVKNRTHAFWNRSNRLIKNFIEANSLIVVTNSLNVIKQTDSLKHWRNETKFKFFCLMFWVLICLLKINDLMCVCDFYFLFYQAMFQRLKKWIL